jgi:hypothetical protein
MSDFLSELVDRHTDKLPPYTKTVLIVLLILAAWWCMKMTPIYQNYINNTPTLADQTHNFANTLKRNS